jgi:hypothetical protein
MRPEANGCLAESGRIACPAVAVTASGTTAFVVNTISCTLTPVSVANGAICAIGAGRTGRPISVGLCSYPTAIEMAPTGALAVAIAP